ncbi:MAG: DUF4349 domain-containing protein [Leptospiraceae bacterium]|nr:DUF4349 domain-containing protein [Leptospiraceae bacterium]
MSKDALNESEEAPSAQAPATERARLSDDQQTGAEKKDEIESGDLFSPIALDVSLDAKERMLEYQVHLNFKSDSVLEARETAYRVASKYGFLSSSRTSAYETQYFQATMRVDSARLYDALKELRSIGILKQESVDVTDHTENLVWQGIKLKREALRSIRRQALQNRAAPQNQIQAENLISASEDQQDQAQFEKWKIQDRVKWATIEIYVQGPAAESAIEVPAYQNALKSVLNSFLALTYWLLENILWLLILAVILWQWKRIWKSLKRMVGKDQ